MCAIVGQINKFDEQWLIPHLENALKRGTDLIVEKTQQYRLYHTRLATNDSKDTYPIDYRGRKFAMNGIVSEKRYKELKDYYSLRSDHQYTVDSAFMLMQWLDNPDWSQFDNPDYVFSFWLLDGDNLYFGNKDYPLYYKHFAGVLWFSSFSDFALAPNDNCVRVYNLKTKELKQIYKFKDLIYGR